MSAAARLVGAEGQPIDPSALCWQSRPAGPDLVRRARRHAFRQGRVIERDGAALLTWGMAAKIEFPRGAAEPDATKRALELLAAIPRSPQAATAPAAPVALGALPFATSAPGLLVIPSHTLFAGADGASVAIVVGNRGNSPDAPEGPPFGFVVPEDDERADEPAPHRFRVESVRPHDDYLARVGAALDAIGTQELAKVVLAREVAITANRGFRQRDLLGRIRALHPTCAGFAIDGFVGASPELLVRRRRRAIRSRPLAGTVARSGDAQEDARLAAGLLGSAKDRREHRYVIDAITATFARFADDVVVPDSPELLELRNVTHLATPVSGTLRRTGSRGSIPSALELAVELHPTPAVGGTPRASALEFLEKHEDLDRDRFAGPVGWVNAAGDGEWWIGIRSALVDGNRARLFAGAGIVEGSDPASELTETQLKLQALLAAFVRP